MIKQIRSALMPRSVKNRLAKIKPLVGGEWDSNSPDVKIFKEILSRQLLLIQDNKCAFCGLKLGETSRPEIEHVVPKGGDKRPAHPELAFHRINLVMACTYCNGSSKKGQRDVLRVRNRNYRLCEFSIVHPIVDDPSEHYHWVSNNQQVIIAALTRKGAYSIALLKLYSPMHAEARAKQIVWDEIVKINPALVNSILAAKIGY